MNCNFTPTFSKIEREEERFHTSTVKSAAGIDQKVSRYQPAGRAARHTLIFVHVSAEGPISVTFVPHHRNGSGRAPGRDQEPKAFTWPQNAPDPQLSEPHGTCHEGVVASVSVGFVFIRTWSEA